MTNYRTCPCGWVYFAVTREYAEHEVKAFRRYYDSLSSERQQSWYGSKPSTLEDYSRCFRCGAEYTEFCDATSEDLQRVSGSTINPILEDT